MTKSVEQYAAEHSRLHPEIVTFLQQYYTIDLAKVIRINVAFASTTSYLQTSMWTVGRTIVIRKGKFNLEWSGTSETRADGKIWHSNNRAIDLATPHGMIALAHECQHIQLWRNRPWWKSVAIWIGDVIRSIRYARTLWSHAQSNYEKEVIAAVDHGPIGDAIRARTQFGDLMVFKGLR